MTGRTNRIVFTHNNFTEEDWNKIKLTWTRLKDEINYAIVGQEVAPTTGTKHLQGYISIKKDGRKCGLRWWKSVLGLGDKVHIENARGHDKHSKKYCSKEGNFFEIGEAGEENGGTVWDQIEQFAKKGDIDGALGVSAEHSIKYIHQIKSLVHHYKKPTFKTELVLRPWQTKALQLLDAQDDRRILFVVDEEGGKGKSALAKHILTTRNAWGCQGKFPTVPSAQRVRSAHGFIVNSPVIRQVLKDP